MSARKVPCTVLAIQSYGGGVYRVELRPQAPLPRFSPGQFLQFALDPYDPTGFWPESRAFSIANPPSEKDRLEILYAVKGRYTTRMERELHAGATVWVKLPYGDFRFDDYTSPRWLIAGGTGITAFSGLLRSVEALQRHVPITLYFGIRSPSLFFYQELIENLANLSLIDEARIFIENGDCPASRPGIAFISGRLQISDFLPSTREAWLAGPPAMISYVKNRLAELQVPPEHIHVDEWE